MRGRWWRNSTRRSATNCGDGEMAALVPQRHQPGLLPLYNLYQKARLRLEVDSMSFVTDIEPQRHPYLGNVVTHDPARVGRRGLRFARSSGSTARSTTASPYSLTAFPLQDVFQIGGIRSVYSKWKGKHPPTCRTTAWATASRSRARHRLRRQTERQDARLARQGAASRRRARR